MKDALGDRMKSFYEDRYRFYLPRKAYVIIRVDGKCFHSYTRKLKKPFDEGLMKDMALTAKYLCENLQGAKLGYTQSDEISILLTDLDTFQTDLLFDGNIQKIVSVTASMAATEFNRIRGLRDIIEYDYHSDVVDVFNRELVHWVDFDARCFSIPNRLETLNYFEWRQQDAVRNSISMFARSMFSHKELNGKSGDQMQEMMFQKESFNWNNADPDKKRGTVVFKRQRQIDTEYDGASGNEIGVYRSEWVIGPAPRFSQDWDWFDKILSGNPYENYADEKGKHYEKKHAD